MVVGGIVFVVLNLLMKKVVVANLYGLTIDYGYNYLTNKDEEYQEERAFGACVREVILRLGIVSLIHCILLALCVVLVPDSWTFGMVPEWAIKAGLMVGIIGSLGAQISFVFSMIMQVGRLVKIDDDGIGWFDDALGGEFSVDIGGCWPLEKYPSIGDCYVVMDGYPKFLFLRPIECERRWRRN